MTEQIIMDGVDTVQVAMQRRIEELCGESCCADGYAPVGWADLHTITAIARAAQDGALNDAREIRSIKITLYTGDVLEIVQDPEQRSVKIKRINKRVKIG